ncbi:MAG: VanZ family protein [Lachnospiraceae bacterium]|nr:VanZ family protein [Lachnospiraceae bacterium]
MKKHIPLTILIILTILFIWGQSVLPASTSASESSWVMDLVRPFLELFTGPGNVTAHLVRKLAHATEYFVLGCEAALWCRWKLKGRKRIVKFLILLAFGLVVAFIDEGIQFFSPGRSMEFLDMMIDLSGVTVAGLVFMAIPEKKKTT